MSNSGLLEETELFSLEELQKLDPRRIPEHVAVIPDGNRRWAKKRFILPEEGHRVGAESLLEIVKASSQIGVKVLTFYVFSTENWERPQREINAQMKLLEKMLISQKDHMVKTGIRFKTIGNFYTFPLHVVERIEEVKNATKHCDTIDVIFAMNYGGRDDLCRAFQTILQHYDEKKIQREQISEKFISSYLDTAEWKDPDLVIRTGGEQRLSNFLLWQISYAEVYFSNLYWPEFRAPHLLEAIYNFQQRERRRGGS